MLPDRVSNPGPLTYESGTLLIALRSPASLLELVWSNSSGLECGVHSKGNQPCQVHFCTKLKPLVKNGWLKPPNHHPTLFLPLFSRKLGTPSFLMFTSLHVFVKLMSTVDVNSRISHRLSPLVNDNMSWTFFD